MVFSAAGGDFGAHRRFFYGKTVASAAFTDTKNVSVYKENLQPVEYAL